MAGDKTPVVEGFINQHITERQQQRGIGSRTDGEPLGALHGAQVIAHRADIDKARPLRLHLFQPVFQHMVVGAAAVDLRITQRQAAECDKQLAFARQLGKVGMLAVQRAQRPENMRQDTLTRRAAVGVGAGGIAAEALEEAVQLTLRVVKTAGAGPAVGAAENRLIAAARFDRIQFAGQQIERHLPAHLNKRLFTASLARSRAILQVARAHRRTANARLAGDRIGERLTNT